eukprot:TRINITY_DN19200_c0_g1_i1.p1 TRINITY_DN19200_c0_g1~~TRINITY_DN19200_c0_g1_i1.p1  ORF type:complete len:216 (-),score=63.73 TRINITY_DN19200_c0_g1_i1:169-774(-)
MGNKAGKNKVTAEDMEFIMSQVEDKSLGTKSAFYRLNFTDSGHTKARMKEWEEGKVNDLNKAQFLSMVTEFGIMGTPKNFEALFDGFDTDEDGVISLKEFVLLIRVMSDETPEDKIKWAFTTYDENKDGFISAEEMKRYVATVCEMMKREGDGEALAEAVMQKVDANQDGKVSHEEAMSACVTDQELLNLLNLSVNKHFHY